MKEIEMKINGFTGFEREFEFCMKVEGKWQEFKCTADFHVKYDTPADNFEMILDTAKVDMWSDKYEEYISYSLSPEEFTNLNMWMQDLTHWDEYYEYMNYND